MTFWTVNKCSYLPKYMGQDVLNDDIKWVTTSCTYSRIDNIAERENLIMSTWSWIQARCEEMCPDKELRMRSREGLLHKFEKVPTVCPRSSDPFYIVSYFIKWDNISWTYSTVLYKTGHYFLDIQ